MKNDLSDLSDLSDLNDDNLIYYIDNLSTFCPIEYKIGGYFDKIVDNFRKNKNKKITDSEYEWYRIDDFDKEVRFQKPNKQMEVKQKKYVNNGVIKTYNYISNISILRRYFYQSGKFQNVVSYTFGDNNGRRLLYPFKILKHKWTSKGLIKANQPVDTHLKKRVCSVCGMIGYKRIDNLIIPNELLDCDEFTIKKIIG